MQILEPRKEVPIKNDPSIIKKRPPMYLDCEIILILMVDLTGGKSSSPKLHPLLDMGNGVLSLVGTIPNENARFCCSASRDTMMEV